MFSDAGFTSDYVARIIVFLSDAQRESIVAFRNGSGYLCRVARYCASRFTMAPYKGVCLKEVDDILSIDG